MAIFACRRMPGLVILERVFEGRGSMGELESVLDEMEEQDLASLPDAIVEEGFARLQRSAERLELLRLRQLAELDRRRPYVRDGYLSLSSWVAHQHRVAYSTATSDVRMARALEAMPKTREGLRRTGALLLGGPGPGVSPGDRP